MAPNIFLSAGLEGLNFRKMIAEFKWEESFIHYTIFMQSEKNNFFCPGILENLIITAQKNVAPYTYSIAQRYMAKKHAKVLHVHWPSNSGLCCM